MNTRKRNAKKKYVLAILVILGSLLLVHGSAFTVALAPNTLSETGSTKVYINALGASSIIGASVTVYNGQNEPVFTGTIGQYNYAVAFLNEGAYTATISKENFASKTISFNIDDIYDKNVYFLDMHPLNPTPTPPLNVFEQYRGFNIYFNSASNNYYAVSFDGSIVSPSHSEPWSLADVKAWIDTVAVTVPPPSDTTVNIAEIVVGAILLVTAFLLWKRP